MQFTCQAEDLAWHVNCIHDVNTIMKHFSRQHIYEALNFWNKQLELLDESEQHVTIVKMDRSSCLDLLKKIEQHSLYTVKHWEPERIEKTSPDCIYYAGFIGSEFTPENCTAVIACRQNDPHPGFMYFDEMTGVKKGYGIKTLQELIVQKANLKLWWLASPGYDESTDSYYENSRLNEQYRKIDGLEEYRVEDTIWGCPASWFFTPNCGDAIKRTVDSEWRIDPDE